MRAGAVLPLSPFELINPVEGNRFDVEVTIRVSGTLVCVVEEIHGHGMWAPAPIPSQGLRVELVFTVGTPCSEHVADLHAIHLDGVLRIALPGILADAQLQRIRAIIGALAAGFGQSGWLLGIDHRRCAYRQRRVRHLR